MHISNKKCWLQMKSSPIHPIVFAALFTRNGRLLYSLGGFSDITLSEKSNIIQFIDVKGHDGWKVMKMSNLYGICRYKCIQSLSLIHI